MTDTATELYDLLHKYVLNHPRCEKCGAKLDVQAKWCARCTAEYEMVWGEPECSGR